MRKVKYIPVDLVSYCYLTPLKVYDVIAYDDTSVVIINDNGHKLATHKFSDDDVLEFIDVTKEYRSEIIDSILM